MIECFSEKWKKKHEPFYKNCHSIGITIKWSAVSRDWFRFQMTLYHEIMQVFHMYILLIIKKIIPQF